MRRPQVVGALVLLVAAVVAAVVLGRGDRPAAPGTATAGTTAAEGTATSAAAPSTLPTTTMSGTTTGAAPGSTLPTDTAADQLPPQLPAVPLDATAGAAGVLTGRLVSIEAIEATGTGLGNVAGPALRLTVELTNGAAAALSLDSSFVQVATGPDLTPASPIDDPSAAPFQGELPAGGSATGVYVFTVDETARDDVTVQVQPTAGAPFLVFRGTVG